MPLSSPIVQPGDVLTEDLTTNFIVDASTEATTLTADNIAPFNVSRYHLDVGDDGPVAGYKFNFQSTSTGTYNNSTYAIISHGSKTSEVEWLTPIPMTEGMVIRAELFAHVNGITVSATTADIADDTYFFRLVAEKDTAATIVLNGEWGTSIAVRNSGGTMTTDTLIDTKAYDVLNFYKYRHVNLSQVWVVPDGYTNFNLSKVRWEFKIPGGHHSIGIKEFSINVYVYKG